MSTETKSTLPWDAPGWVEFYETRRSTTEDIYPSEWFFLKDILVEGIRVLDIGCALGGLSSVLSEHLAKFQYTGVDISESMIERAKQKHPTHRFYVIEEADLAVLADETFDLVVCLGVLHLSRKWRELISSAWNRGDIFLCDLRETPDATVEDEAISYYQMDEAGGRTLPYNIINSAEALGNYYQSVFWRNEIASLWILVQCIVGCRDTAKDGNDEYLSDCQGHFTNRCIIS